MANNSKLLGRIFGKNSAEQTPIIPDYKGELIPVENKPVQQQTGQYQPCDNVYFSLLHTLDAKGLVVDAGTVYAPATSEEENLVMRVINLINNPSHLELEILKGEVEKAKVLPSQRRILSYGLNCALKLYQKNNGGAQ